MLISTAILNPFSGCHLMFTSDLPRQGTMSGLQERCDVASPVSSGDGPGDPGLARLGGDKLSTYLSKPSLSF